MACSGAAGRGHVRSSMSFSISYSDGVLQKLPALRWLLAHDLIYQDLSGFVSLYVVLRKRNRRAARPIVICATTTSSA